MASTSTEVSERELEKLSSQLRSIPDNMRIFSVSFRSLYAENAVGSLSDTEVEFNELRDDIRNYALVYVKVALPWSTKFVRMIRDFLGDYKATKFEQWEEGLDEELKKVKGYIQFCEVLLFVHEKVMTGLKRKEGQAKVLVKKLAATSKEFEMKMKEMNDAATLKEICAAIIGVLPTVGSFAEAFLKLYGQYQRSTADAYQKKAGLYGAASAVVSGTLIPVLAAFLDVLSKISAFFSVQENLLKMFQDRGLDAKGKTDSPKKNSQEARMKRHYQVMRGWAEKIEEDCDMFFAVLPDMKTDFAAIPEEETDDNVVQAWLEKRQSDVRRKFQGQITELVQTEILDFKL